MESSHPEQERTLQLIAQRLVRAFSPRRILLYGSRANGTARPDSDYDLLIVWRDETPPAPRTVEVRRVLSDLDTPMDIAVVTPVEFERYRTRRMHIVAVADREGRVFHAA